MLNKLSYGNLLKNDVVYIHFEKNIPIYDIEYFLLNNCNYYWHNSNDPHQDTLYDLTSISDGNLYFCLEINKLEIHMYIIYDNNKYSEQNNYIISAKQILRYIKLNQILIEE